MHRGRKKFSLLTNSMVKPFLDFPEFCLKFLNLQSRERFRNVFELCDLFMSGCKKREVSSCTCAAVAPILVDIIIVHYETQDF